MKGLMRTLQERVLSAGASPDVGGKNLVAFSGGVDSSLVAALVYKAYPRNSVACVGVSAALPSAQLQLARSVASHIGWCLCMLRHCIVMVTGRWWSSVGTRGRERRRLNLLTGS